MDDFTHFNDDGRAKMVDVGEKAPSRRTAAAGGRVLVSRETFERIRSGGVKKGDVLATAQIAGVMAAKHTPDLIPLCHPVLLDGIDLRLTLDEARCAVDIRAEVSCQGRTGVEMEALSAVSAAALTVYDMCKAVQRDMVITDIRLLEKTGGIHGDFRRADAPSLDQWLREAKAEPGAADCGMYLFHRGVVRRTPKAQVRGGAADSRAVTSMRFFYNESEVSAAVAEARGLPGIQTVRVWLAQGRLPLGGDLMQVLVGGDIRPHVLAALETLVARLKTRCVREEEEFSQEFGNFS
ncbi:MAG: cyclic pyranopterin monophosphate synthase MoaC [Oscillospiraceae bacterium]|nr:cyclic pyranopterin monophosphate synthase MoaC [Oscillospiraceae bacterium]